MSHERTSTWRAALASGLENWRSAIPPRGGWLALWASPSSYLLLISWVAVAVVKARALMLMDGVSAWPLVWIWAVSADAVLHGGLAALFTAAEMRRPWTRALTIPLALLVCVVALINAAYLGAAGEQLSWEAVQYGLGSWHELMGIVSESLQARGLVAMLGIAVVLLAVPALAWWLQQKRAVPRSHAIHCAVVMFVVALLVWLIAPAPRLLSAASLGRSATMNTYWSWLADDDSAGQGAGVVEFMGYQPQALVSEQAIADFAAGPRPNVVLLVLESTRYDLTSLAPQNGQNRAQTPNLQALAERGTSVPITRAVLPHTTKSVFSMLCARVPLMQREPLEVSTTIAVQCLPDIMRAAGYRTGFFQSALGTFEQRPRLVAQLGYEHFQAWEDIGGQPLGYLASDDESLAKPLATWIDSGSEPFFATLLTSATHHPYRLAQSSASTATPESDEARYVRLVEAEDRLLGRVLAALEARGLSQRTIVVVAGDHGEGFGAKGVRQHDNNFYEEGLRVPLVLAGPGVPVGTIPGNASLIDVTPSILDLLGMPVPRVEVGDRPVAFSLFAGALPEDEPRWFGCYYDSHCRGFVLGSQKVVHIPQLGHVFYFDLAADPDERAARPLTPELAEHLPAMHRVIDSHRTYRWPVRWGPIPAYGQWTCPEGQGCKHPRSPPGVFFESP